MKAGKYIVSLVIFLTVSGLYAQQPQFDKLEMLFAQGHYKKVQRHANRLLDKPEYDYSLLPKYYKSLSLMQLSQNDRWFARHDNALDEAIEVFLEVKKGENSEKLFNAHMYELIWVRDDLMAWAGDLKRMGKQEEFEKVRVLIDKLFDDLPDTKPAKNQPEKVDTAIIFNNLEVRDKIVVTAKKYIGVPYVWAGSSPEGFDCSGFTGYVMSELGMSLPRRSVDQYNDARQVKRKNVQKGDLVFFANGSGISHVGIIISEKGAPLEMIHASSSKGIIITRIDDSEYWLNRIHGYGTYLN